MTETKVCWDCKRELELTHEFFGINKNTKSGLSTRCKRCSRIESRKWVEKNREASRKKSKDWHNNNKDKAKAYFKKWSADNKYKIKAHTKVRVSLKNGTIIKKTCEVCGNTDVRAHHDDYSKPLDVRWLCNTHHNRLHSELKNHN